MLEIPEDYAKIYELHEGKMTFMGEGRFCQEELQASPDWFPYVEESGQRRWYFHKKEPRALLMWGPDWYSTRVLFQCMACINQFEEDEDYAGPLVCEECSLDAEKETL